MVRFNVLSLHRKKDAPPTPPLQGWWPGGRVALKRDGGPKEGWEMPLPSPRSPTLLPKKEGSLPGGRTDGAHGSQARRAQVIRKACVVHAQGADGTFGRRPHPRPLSLSPSPSPKGRVATGRGGGKPLDRPDILLPVVGGLKGPNSLFHSRILPRCHPPFWGEALGPGGVKYIFSLTASV